MSSSDLAIRVTDLSKCYQIYAKPIDRLKQALAPRVLGVLGRSARVYYREFWALQNLSLEAKKGETLGIIGRNGSGKSTLLQMLCGTLTPTSGTIETQGRITALLELGSGFNPDFTGRENVFLNGAILGLRQEEMESHFDAIASFADIGDFIEQPVKFYSSGMIVRLAFAVQAMVDPDILIVDEALAVGDEKFQRKCFRRLDELKQNGTSILFVSHSIRQITELCDRALLVEQGRRLLLADPLTVVRAYHQIIYANPAEQARLTQEYRELDRGGVARVEPSPAADPLPEDIVPSPGKLAPHPETEEPIPEIDFYQSDMLPQSTVIYPTQGARIDSITIYNSLRQQVNNLLAGRAYQFEIQGTFLEARELVSIGMHIRALTGVEITALGYPGLGQYFQGVKHGQKFRLVHTITMRLTPGTYFVGGGISSTSEPIQMHRILDAIMFRVLPQAGRRAMGYVDLSVGEPEFEIHEL